MILPGLSVVITALPSTASITNPLALYFDKVFIDLGLRGIAFLSWKRKVFFVDFLGSL